MSKNAIDIEESAFAPSMPQEREACDPQVNGFHTCWLMRNVRLAQMDYISTV